MPAQRVPQSSIDDFCKHAHGIVRVTTRSVAQETQRPQEAAVEAVREALEDDLYQDPVQVSIVLAIAVCFDLFVSWSFFTYRLGVLF